MIARDCCCRSGIISASEGLGLVLLGVLGFGNEETSCGLGAGMGSTGALATAVLGADWPAMLAESEPARLIFFAYGHRIGIERWIRSLESGYAGALEARNAAERVAGCDRVSSRDPRG